ncbi:hypothetical protein K443DRAFT_8212 [Laccaria amethystina LaAM-08-1]|uniref:Uncharacterized protein n=1 Tax=Laccaria amethystina LaAM-08-1 TaxID=1095629 RepID=A0A0C9XQ15_9AGAR|nr:hypothetical protein K443DRAFT_8212 [Laccaria amethystina LaAM-08-1]
MDVNIDGEGAKTTIIGWGDGGFSSDAAKKTFPLRIGPLARYNLLYAVSFLRSPEEMDAFSFARAAGVGGPPQSDLQRAVTTNIFEKPYIPPRPSTETSPLLYPTNTFSSRWNCVLDLAAHQAQALDAMDVSDPAGGSILPEPASTFPVFATNSASSSRTHYTGSGTPTYTTGSTPQASSRRSTLTPGGYFAGRSIKGLTPNRSAMFLHPGFAVSPLNSGRLSTSSAPISSGGDKFPTTYSAPAPHTPGVPPSSAGLDAEEHQGPPLDAQTTPQTPAYLAFPPKSTVPPPSPMSLGPIASQTQANVGPSVEIRRERGAAGEIPRTPGPYVPSAFGEQGMLNKLQSAAVDGEYIIVSVGLLREWRGWEWEELLSGRPRRLEVTCPGERRRGKGRQEEEEEYDGRRIGEEDGVSWGFGYGYPLRPPSCQSVRMDFLAVSPGVHSTDTLTLTDVEIGFAMNLRAVMDIVVHDPDD